MRNQLDKETKEKYMEGILSKSQEWEWYIKHIEDTYEIDFSINSLSDFHKCFSDVDDIFNSLIKINRLIPQNLVITSKWLIVLNDISLLYLGKKDYSDLDLYNDFFKTLALLTYTAKIYNDTNKTDKMLLYLEIFELNNLYQLYNIDLFLANKNFILSKLDEIGYNTNNERLIFLNNVNETYIPCNSFIDDNRSAIIHANCFDYRKIEEAKCNTWQEKYLHDMLQTNYSHGKLSPIMCYNNGQMIPDFSAWSPDIINIMKTDFNDNDASFIVESVAYALHGTIPSSNTILKHAQLLYEYWTKGDKDNKRYSVSSFEFLISFFNDKRIHIDGQVYRLYNSAAKTIVDDNILISINSRYMFRDKSIRKRIRNIINDQKANIINISNEQDFLSTIENTIIIAESDNQVFNVLSNKFDDVLEHGSRMLPNLFLKYLLYLIKIRQNCNIQQDEVSKEIIRIRYLWKDQYYSSYVPTMSIFSHSIEIKKDDIEKYNKSVMENPFGLALSCMTLSDDLLLDSLISMSQNALSLLVTKVLISEDFPSYKKINLQTGRHEVDLSFRDYLSNMVNENSYKFMNILKPEEFLFGFYQELTRKIDMNLMILNIEEKMYQCVKEQNPEYEFIDYSDIPKLAHLTQLFPIIENKIRFYGELIGIAPICLDLERYNQLKEPTTILSNIIMMIYKSAHSFKLTADFFMIYFCLYSSLGYNIRNEAIHGKSYVENKSSIAKAFRITLFCLYLIDFRIEICFNEMRKNTVFLNVQANLQQENES